MINVVVSTISVAAISDIKQGGSQTATITLSNLYQATVPALSAAATGSDGSTPVTGLSATTPMCGGGIVSNGASCTSSVNATNAVAVAENCKLLKLCHHQYC